MTKLRWGSPKPFWLINPFIEFALRKYEKQLCPNLIRALHVICIVHFLFLINSCTKPEFDTSLQAESDALQLLSTTEIVPVCYTEKTDPIPSSGVLQNCAGVYFDPILGKINASFATQFRLPLNNINFGENAQVDSMVLSLPYSGAYGDIKKLNGLQKFKIYEIDSNDSISTSKAFKSNHVFPVVPESIGETDFFVPRLNENVQVGSTSAIPQLRIKLKSSLSERFVAPENVSKFANSDAFLSFFKGIVVQSELLNEQSGQGSIIYFDLLRGAKIELYYKNAENDSLQINFVVNELSARVNTFKQEYSNTIETALNNEEIGKQELYIQSTGGLRAALFFPELNEWKAGRRILINKAELEMSVDEGSIGIYAPPLKIDPITKNVDGLLFDIVDYSTNLVKPVGGNYLINEKKYRFTITRYIQELLDGKEDRGLYLVSTASAITANRIKIFGPEAAEKPLKLKLIYQIL